jgi:hypothetical protein
MGAARAVLPFAKGIRQFGMPRKDDGIGAVAIGQRMITSLAAGWRWDGSGTRVRTAPEGMMDG